jgi:hypothetical protein
MKLKTGVHEIKTLQNLNVHREEKFYLQESKYFLKGGWGNSSVGIKVKATS